jgi:hypothetical protein
LDYLEARPGHQLAMSSTTTPSPTTTSPSPASSATHHVESGVTIPTTTVVGIGAGFVAFALSLLGSLLLVRFAKLALRARREGIPVRQAWNDQGGLFGWLHGFGARDRDTDRVRRIEEIERSGYWAGGGGWYSSEILRMRLWNEIRREGMKVKDDLGERPGMWEVGLGEGKGQENVEELEDEKRLDTYHVSLVSSCVIGTTHSYVTPIFLVQARHRADHGAIIDRTYPYTPQIRPATCTTSSPFITPHSPPDKRSISKSSRRRASRIGHWINITFSHNTPNPGRRRRSTDGIKEGERGQGNGSRSFGIR